MEQEVGRHVIRPYRAEDRASVRAICADTGFLGQPIDPVFEDRELFADYLTSYYTDAEPESTFVCEIEGQVMGYVMGSRFPGKKEAFEKRMMPRLVMRGVWRYFARPYRASTRRYVWWLIARARHEVPHAPPAMPHFHFNMRAEARTVAGTRAIIDMFFEYLRGCGDLQVYGQVVAFESRRGARMFERYGFRIVDEREVTKYRELDPRKVFLFTIVKDLSANATLYGLDLHKQAAPAAREDLQ